MHDPLIFGEVLFDCLDEDCVIGGAPFNVAWHLQGFGLKPQLVSRVGADAPGERIVEEMHLWGMDTHAIGVDPSHPTGRVHVRLQEGQPHYEIVDNQAYDYIEIPQGGLGVPEQILYHGTLALRYQHNRTVMDKLRLSKRVFFDVNLRDPWWHSDEVLRLIAKADWLKLNQEEHVLLLGADALPGKWFLNARLRAVSLTRGKQGADIYLPHWQKAVPAPKLNPIIDAIGAGDAFSAIIILGLIRQWPWELILQRATIFSARVCTWRGAVITDRRIYEEVSHEWV